MKIDLKSVDLNSFKIKEGVINGQIVYLINPSEFNCKWTTQNLHFRSLMVDFEGNILSRGLNKFFNAGESPDLYPNPEKHKDWVLTNKEDGSLGIFDYIYGSLNVRTRGTVSYKDHENTSDFDFVIQKYNIESLVKKYQKYSILFEIYSPTNVIVLKPYTEPEIVLLGAINKETGIYYPFHTDLGKEIQSIINCKVPEIYKLSGNIVDIIENIKLWENKEGVVLNYNNSQNQLKIKSQWYLTLHRFKSGATLENTLDLYFSYGKPSYQDFQSKLIETFDYECFEMVRGYASQVCDASKEVNNIVDGFKYFIDNQLKQLNTRKEQAQKVLSSYAQSNRSAMVFTLLDGKNLTSDQEKKLFWQVLKN